MPPDEVERQDHHPAILGPEKTALIIVDMQEKLHPYVADKDEVLRNVQMLIKFAEIYDIPVVLTEHYPKGLGSTIPEVKEALAQYAPLEKVIFSCCGASGFEDRLRELDVRRAVIAGIESHICVAQTTLDLLHKGYEVHVIADAVSSRTIRNRDIGIEKMRGFGAVISSTEMTMYEIMERADTKEFKEVLKLVK